MIKFCFEMYEFGERGRVFLGYKQIEAEDLQTAKLSAQELVGYSVSLFPIYI